MEKFIKIGLAILLFLCLFNMPYGYYQLVRFITMVAFVAFGYREWEQGNKNIALGLFGLALLFQPFVKIALGRSLWNFVDVMVGLGLLISIFYKKANR